MPIQRTFFGQPVTLRMPPRRFQLLFAVAALITASLVLLGPPSSTDLPTYDYLREAVKNPHLPTVDDLPNVPRPFGPATHKPPVQPNSTAASSYRAIEWLGDFKWRNPFSSALTLDENRAVLPPLKERPPIYTFYDVKGKQDKALSAAENRLILAWRRAWWAQGFKPQVLSSAEAMEHPQFRIVQQLKLDAKTESEMLKWLAWSHVKGGVLANWLALPMARSDNPMLAFLRRNEYPTLSRIEGLQNGVFFGDATAVDAAIKEAVHNHLLKNTTANADKIAELGKKEGGVMVNLLGSANIAVDKKANGIAYYSTETIVKLYKSVADKLGNTTQAEGLDTLANLINSHVHLTFQENYPEGVTVVKPLPEHTTALMYEAIDIARNLTQCPASPLPKSCPPNRQKCKPCDSAKTKKLQLLPSFKTSSSTYTIGTVPHPYTLNSLHYTRDTLDANFLVRNAEHDLWINAATKDFLGDKHGPESRLMHFKELVAAEQSPANTLWLTAERVTQADLDWVFGFALPQHASENTAAYGKSELTVFPRPPLPPPIPGVEVPEERWIKNEEERLKKAREALRSKERRMREVVDAVEKWSLADTEAWKFARAFSARRRVERKKWEVEEETFAGSERKAGVGGGGGRWTDKFRI
ncbi:hypothetical protein BDV95DRAFT_605794 [Massariosphaeria phaeospora]|uniref:Uncharacterized protein n=1 Tax=Massariosphaeria phaeospora TaxID=100035 RepID=A0A7C8I8C7_9PLEO|nr:hypothetical protein BDV95DRAFT_605794 [Massariosphaeria phaeospora]